MKKSLSIVLVLLLLLTACQTVPDDDQSLASTPTSSSSITPPPSSSMVPPASSTAPTVPTTQPTIPTTQPTVPTTQPTTPSTVPTTDISDGDIKQNGSHLYWVVKSTQERILICDQVMDSEKNDTHIFFVTSSEPTKIYAVAIGDFANQQLCYESTHGNIKIMYNANHANHFLQFLEDERRFLVLDLTTGEAIFLMEQYHMFSAYMYIDEDGNWSEIISFEGQHTEDDVLYTAYLYNRITGELEVEDTSDCDCEECV